MITNTGYNMTSLENLLYLKQIEERQNQLLNYAPLLTLPSAVSASPFLSQPLLPSPYLQSHRSASMFEAEQRSLNLELTLANALLTNQLKTLVSAKLAGEVRPTSVTLPSQTKQVLKSFTQDQPKRTSNEKEDAEERQKQVSPKGVLLPASKKISKESLHSKNKSEADKKDLIQLALKPKKQRRLASQISRPFKCPIGGCGKAYGHEASLKVHFNNKHAWSFTPPYKSN